MKLSDLANEIREPFDPKKNTEEILYIGLEHILPKTLRIDSYSYSNITESLKYKFKYGDILFGTMRPYFKKIAKAPYDGVCSTEFSVIRSIQNTDSNYIFYLLAQDFFIKFCNVNSKGDRPRVKWKYFSKFKVPHDKKEKRFIIGNILSTYDCLIDTNCQRIQLLEESARLLFREWFVYFRFPGHEKVKIVDGVPEGWKRVPLPELIDFKEGPGLRNYQFKEEGIPFLNIRSFGSDEIDLGKVKYLKENEVYGKYKHFLLREDDHVVSSSGTLGRLVTIRKSHLPLMLNTSLIRMRPKKPMGKWMLKAYLLYGGFIEKTISLAIGAAQLNFGPAHLKKMTILFPKSSEIVSEFEELISVTYLLKKNLLDQNKKLAQARDLLLPRLMNGTIDVSESNIKVPEGVEI